MPALLQPWSLCNRLTLTLAGHLQGLWGMRRRARPHRIDKSQSAPSACGPHLVLAWGRLGDTVLTRGWLEALAAGLQGPIVVAARPEVLPLWRDLADSVVPLQGETQEVLDALGGVGPFTTVMTDIHWFHGGELRWPGLLAACRGAHKWSHYGYAPKERLAPARSWPRSVQVLRSGADCGAHVLHHQDGYLRGLIEQLNALGLWRSPTGDPSAGDRSTGEGATGCRAPSLPADWGAFSAGVEQLLPPGFPGRAEAGGGAIPPVFACQPYSNLVKKDLPRDVWRGVFAAHTGARFLLLGVPAQQRQLAALADGETVFSLGGRTSVEQAAALIRWSDGFVGVDSGLAHIAAALGVPAVIASANNNLGAFFPYPEHHRRGWQAVDLSPQHMACAGCFSVCSKAPVWRSMRRGLPCVRSRGPLGLVESVRHMASLNRSHTRGTGGEVQISPGASLGNTGIPSATY